MLPRPKYGATVPVSTARASWIDIEDGDRWSGTSEPDFKRPRVAAPELKWSSSGQTNGRQKEEAWVAPPTAGDDYAEHDEPYKWSTQVHEHGATSSSHEVGQAEILLRRLSHDQQGSQLLTGSDRMSLIAAAETLARFRTRNCKSSPSLPAQSTNSQTEYRPTPAVPAAAYCYNIAYCNGPHETDGSFLDVYSWPHS
ncbi:unnamed protein product [Polarella glacialis]|uniref:Uncharacterized protein n=1 Tax=Polarella glacialis TaxID=89957 RepID=A0A813DB19_POLGL|nr:unnamed protein product [Polarella glacialis]